MPDVKWTDAQKNAINSRKGSVLVSAAAGSGKTAVLVKRIIDSITDKENPVSIDRMLIVTFTRAASAEMRSRIEEAINKLLKNDPYNSYLLHQKQLLYSARISTIDGFCTDFVRQYFYKLNIQSDFRIAEEGELNILRSKALDLVMEKYYSEKNSDFKNLVNSTCTLRNDDYLRKHIENTYNFLTSVPFMDDWMNKMLSHYKVDSFTKTPYFEYTIDYAKSCIEYCLRLIETSEYFLDKDEYLTDEQIEKISDMLISDRCFFDALSSALCAENWDNIKELIDSFSFSKFPTIKGSNDDPNKEIIKNQRKFYKDELNKLAALFNKDLKEINAGTKELLPIIKTFFDCIKDFRKEFSKLKFEKNLLDFADIEDLMVNLLCENKDGKYVYTETAREISAMFDMVFVDEFQDINEVQDLIFSAVCGEKNNLFVVGDVKQSIYGFRQAKPEIFIDYKEDYPVYNPKDEAYPAKIILDKNFRSRLGIIEACNFIFSTLMSKTVGGIEYNEEERLSYGAPYTEDSGANMELMLINSSEIDEENNETELSLEAQTVCEKIKNLIYVEKLRIKDKNTGENRPLALGDIVILIRSPKGDTRRAVTFVNVLNENGITANSEEKNSFFDAPEIKLILNFLSVIDNPVQDIPLLSVLMSPMFSFTADDVAKLRISDKNSPLYIALKNSSDKKCVDFINTLNKLRTISVTTTVDRLIGIIMNLTGFDCVAMAADKFNINNIYLLQNYARSYAENGYKTLTAFINYIERMKGNGTILNSVNKINDTYENAVRVMSIHASKGLEFPVCFLCCTSTEFNLREISGDLVLNADNGVGFRMKKDIIKYDTTQRKILSLMQKDKLVSEEMRILYVALTRAKERLIVTSTNKDPEKYIMNLENRIVQYPIPSYVIKKMKSYSDWLFTCALSNPGCDIRNFITPDYTHYKDGYKPWKVSIINKKSYEEIEAEKEETKPEETSAVDEKFLDEFKKRVSFTYKDAPLSSLPQKISASEFSHKDNDIFKKILRKPSFISDKPVGGAEKGTAFHNFMERCDIKNALESCEAEAERLCEDGFLTERQVELLDYKNLRNFLNGSLINRVLKSENYEREFQFTVKIDACEYNPELKKDFSTEKIVMQGAVDLVFVEDGEAVIVDYKTDRVKDISKLKEIYHKQVELYKSAVEETTGLKVKEVMLYSVHLNKEIII